MNPNSVGCTCLSPINIALVKYWGKRDDELNLPINSSLSITLENSQFFTKTKVDMLLSRKKNKSILYIDGKLEPISNHPKISKLLHEAKKMGLVCPVRIETSNNFPTAAGLASSASGLSAIALCIGKLLNLSQNDTAILSRVGSGSSCRSIYGGYVLWDCGKLEDGSDSIPRQLFPHDFWPEMRVLIIRVSSSAKNTPSTSGMNRCTKTSELLKLKGDSKLSETRIEMIKESINQRNFNGFAEVVMRESNTLHAVCLDAYPPIVPTYLSSASFKIIEFVHALNTFNGSTICAYSFDAGPNAFIFILKPNVKLFLASFFSLFSPSQGNEDRSYNSLLNLYGIGTPIPSIEKFGMESDSNCKFEQVLISKPGAGPNIIF